MGLRMSVPVRDRLTIWKERVRGNLYKMSKGSWDRSSPKMIYCQKLKS
jgi:hypothetical protein